MATPSINRSKNTVAEHKLQPPMWQWSPFFLGLPIAVLELIFSKFEFQLPSEAHPRVDSVHTTELLRKRVSLKDPHPFNTLAATSPSMRDSIEVYCEHLLETYRKTTCNKCLSTDEKYVSKNLHAFNEMAGASEAAEDEATSQPPRISITHRGNWLRHVSHSCAFCGSTTGEAHCAPFNRIIQVCTPCEKQQWRTPIALEAAMKKLPLHHILWPPQGYVLQWARKRRPLLMDNRVGPEFLDYLLDGEVETVAKAIKDDPIRHTPIWAMYDLTVNFTKRSPWDLLMEKTQDAGDIDFELHI